MQHALSGEISGSLFFFEIGLVDHLVSAWISGTRLGLLDMYAYLKSCEIMRKGSRERHHQNHVAIVITKEKLPRCKAS
jgi:hypothetical protein